MTTSAIVISIVVALAVAQVIAVSPWLARRTVRLAARLRYGDTDRGRTRAEDLAAYIDTCPGPLLNLGAALCFLAVGSAVFAHRRSRALLGRISAFVEAGSTRQITRRRRLSALAMANLAMASSIGALLDSLHLSFVSTLVAGGIGSAIVAASVIGAPRVVARIRRSSSGPGPGPGDAGPRA